MRLVRARFEGVTPMTFKLLKTRLISVVYAVRLPSTLLLLATLLVACTSSTDSGDEGPGAEERSNSVSSAVYVQGAYREIWSPGPGTNWCLDQYAFGTSQGTQVVQWPCNGLANEAWYLDGFGHLRGYGNQCVTANTANYNVASLMIAPCGAYPGLQEWIRIYGSAAQGYPTGFGLSSSFTNNSSGDGWCVTRAYPYTTAGTPLKLRPCGPGQGGIVPEATMNSGFLTPWPTSSTAATIIGMKTRCAGVYDGTNGGPVIAWDCAAPSGAPTQQWTLNSSGQITILGKCMESNGTGNGAPVGLWACNANATQRWNITYDGQIVNQASGRCLDLSSYSLANGAGFGIWDCYYGMNQVYRVSF